MEYADKLASAKTVRDLYEVLEYFRSEIQKYSHGSCEPLDLQKLEKCQKAHFYFDRAKAQIMHLESKGEFLAAINSEHNAGNDEH